MAVRSGYVGKKPLLAGGVIEKTIEELNWLDRVIFSTISFVGNLCHKTLRRDQKLTRKTIQRSEQLLAFSELQLHELLTSLHKQLCCQAMNDE